MYPMPNGVVHRAVPEHEGTLKREKPSAILGLPPIFPRQSVLREKSPMSANGQHGQTEAAHISRVDCRRDVEKKSHPKGVERDGQGHYITAAMTSLVIAWFRSPQTWNPKSPGPPPVTGAFSFIRRQVGEPGWAFSLVGLIAVAQGGLASGLSDRPIPGPDCETLSLVDLTDFQKEEARWCNHSGLRGWKCQRAAAG